ncbi:MAG: hypothetical protein R3E76_05405 [Planctomycetota bacterium]
MKMNWILAVALMAVLGCGAAFAQDGDKPARERDRPAKGERKGDRPAKGERGEGHAEKHRKIRQHLAELEAKLKRAKAKQAEGDAENPERLNEVISRLETKIAEIKAKIAAHREKHGEGRDEGNDS